MVKYECRETLSWQVKPTPCAEGVNAHRSPISKEDGQRSQRCPGGGEVRDVAALRVRRGSLRPTWRPRKPGNVNKAAVPNG